MNDKFSKGFPKTKACMQPTCIFSSMVVTLTDGSPVSVAACMCTVVEENSMHFPSSDLLNEHVNHFGLGMKV